jgi:3-deoxy-D-manno-octulosonic-acid transferase
LNKSDKPVWIHALSVGEVISSQPLVEKIIDNYKRPVVFSVSTQTGYQTAKRILGSKIDFLFFSPYDIFFVVQYVIKKIDPYIIVLVESDIWPNFMHTIKKEKIPTILVNARLSVKSYKGYKRFSHIFIPMLLQFRAICAQTQDDSKRFISLGLPKNSIVTTGNIKFDQKFDNITKEDIKRLNVLVKSGLDKKIFIAGSTHKGEETVLSKAFLNIKKIFKNSIFIVVPRNPDRALSVKKIFSAKGFSTVFYTDVLNKKTEMKSRDVLIVDTIGILTTLYAISDVVFIGGSMANEGGHNPLEAAFFSKPVIFGPYMEDFKLISNMLIEFCGAVTVTSDEEISKIVLLLFSDSVKAYNIGNNAKNVFLKHKGAVDKTIEVIRLIADNK